MDGSRITECEIATSNRAKCHSCQKKILKGTPRICFTMQWTKRIKDKNKFRTTEYIKEQGGYVPWVLPIKRSICYKCAEKILDLDVKNQKNEIQRLRKIKNIFKRKMKKEKIQELIKNYEIMEVLEK